MNNQTTRAPISLNNLETEVAQDQGKKLFYIGIDKTVNAINSELKSNETSAKKKDVIESQTQSKKSPLLSLEDYEYLRITKEKKIARPRPTVTIDGAAIATPGNLLGISAQIKAGKTAIKGVILSGTLSESGTADGFPTIKCEPANGKAIIDFDTEQSELDQQDNLNSFLQRVGIEDTPDNLRSYNIRQLNMSDYKEFTNNICELCSEKFGGIHLIAIDGGADYIKSVNDEEQANEILEYFTHLAIRFCCPVIIIVHLNPNSDKERGHLGSQLQRKCFGLLTIEKAKGSDISILIPKAFRKAGNADVQPIHFAYDKEKHYHMQIEAPDSEKEKACAIMTRHKVIAQEVFGNMTSYSYSNAVKAIMKHTNRKERTAKEMMKDMSGWNFIVKGIDNNYRLNKEEYD